MRRLSGDGKIVSTTRAPSISSLKSAVLSGESGIRND